MRNNLKNAALLGVLVASIFATIVVFHPTKTLAASGVSGIAWPVDSSVSPWYIQNGYYTYDHGCLIVGSTGLNCSTPGNPGQLYGFDLKRSSTNNAATDNQHVYSPVNGTIGYATNGNYPGYAIGIQVDNTANLWVSLVHLTNMQVTSGHVTAGQYLGDIIQQDAQNNTHLHFNLFRQVGGVRIPVPFMNDTGNLYGGYDTHIIGCAQNQYVPAGILNWNNKTYTPPPGKTVQSIENQYGNWSTVSCGLQAHLVSTTVNFTLSLTGIGTNTASGLNNNPLHPTLNAVVQVRNSSNQTIQSIKTNVTYNRSNGLYAGSVPISGLTAGNYYIIAVKLNNTLNKLASNWFLPGGTVTEPTMLPLSGDVDGNNTIDIQDYNDLMACYNPQRYGPCRYQIGSDLNDNGSVDGVDYNILLRSMQGIH